jgi:hypothetical protein
LLGKDSKFSILELLAKQSSGWNEIKEKLHIRNPTTLAYWRTKLTREKLIKQDAFRGKYSLTDLGLIWVREERNRRVCALNPQSVKLTLSQGYVKEDSFMKMTKLIFLFPIVDRGVPYSLTAFLDSADFQFQERIVDELKKESDDIANGLYSKIEWMVKDLKGSEPSPMQVEKRLEYMKNTFDFEITLTFNFSPRRALEGVDWNEARQKARQSEQGLSEQIRKDMESLRTMTPDERRRYIEEWIMSESQDYLCRSDKSEKDLLDKLVDQVCQAPALPYLGESRVDHYISRNEIRHTLDDMLRKRTIETERIWQIRKK